MVLAHTRLRTWLATNRNQTIANGKTSSVASERERLYDASSESWLRSLVSRLPGLIVASIESCVDYKEVDLQ